MKQVNRNDECPECGHSDEDENGLTELRFVGIEFDAKKIPYQQQELNRCLQAKYRIVERVQTPTGLVFVNPLGPAIPVVEIHNLLLDNLCKFLT